MLLPDTDNEKYSKVLSTHIQASASVAHSLWLVTFNYMQYSMASVTNANNTLSAFTTPPFSFCAGLSRAYLTKI